MHKTPVSTTTTHTCTHHSREKRKVKRLERSYTGQIPIAFCLRARHPEPPTGAGFIITIYIDSHTTKHPQRGRAYEKVVSGKNIEVKNGQSKDRSSEDKGSEKAP